MPSMPRAKSACANVGKATLAQQTISSGSYEFGPSRIVTSQRGSQMTPFALCSSHQPWIDLTRPSFVMPGGNAPKYRAFSRGRSPRYASSWVTGTSKLPGGNG